MNGTISRFLGAAAALSLGLSAAVPGVHAAEKTDFKVAWSIYVGWMPWGYAADSGIVKKWSDKYSS
jgi:NitT/TauT family transport system substrate-binding protein